MKSLLFSAAMVFIFGLTLVNAQDRGGDITSEQLRDMARTTSVPDHRTVDTRGTPFFNEDFTNGSITFQNGQTTNVMPLRYNAYENNLQFMSGDHIYAVENNTVRSFELYATDGIIRFEKGYDARRLSPEDFVAVMADGKAKFMVKHTVNYREDISGYGQATQVEEYSPSREYYVKFGDGDVDRIRSLSERRVMRIFPSHEDELEQFASQNNIQFDNIMDLARLFNHYNSLQAETNQ